MFRLSVSARYVGRFEFAHKKVGAPRTADSCIPGTLIRIHNVVSPLGSLSPRRTPSREQVK